MYYVNAILHFFELNIRVFCIFRDITIKTGKRQKALIKFGKSVKRLKMLLIKWTVGEYTTFFKKTLDNGLLWCYNCFVNRWGGDKTIQGLHREPALLRVGWVPFGKWTAEGAVKGEGWVFCDVGHTLIVWDMFVSWKGARCANQGGTADTIFSAVFILKEFRELNEILMILLI